jgi:hypothetical protein
MNWNRISLFKMPNKHKRFEYIPRYYNEDKEVIQAKIDRAREENLVDKNGNYARSISFQSKMQDRWGNPDHKVQTMRSNFRLIIILIILLVAFYYVFIGLDGIGYFIDANKEKLH